MLGISGAVRMAVQNSDGKLEKLQVIAVLSALAQETRLAAFRLLVQAGPEGMSAGAVATALGVRGAGLSFHFERLRHAGLLRVRRQGRRKIYAAEYATVESLLLYLKAQCSTRATVGRGAPNRRAGGLTKAR